MNRLLISLLFVLMSGLSFGQTTLVVTKISDPDPFTNPYNYDDLLCDPDMYGTLQWAIRKANDPLSSGTTTVNFNISGTGAHVINLSYQLPVIEKDIFLDGTTQSGYSFQNPVIVIDGAQIGGDCFVRSNLSSGNAFKVKGFYLKNFDVGIKLGSNSDGFEIIDNVINRMYSCILIQGSSNGIIKGNVLGIDLNTFIMPESKMGISFYSDWGSSIYSSNNIIGGTGINEANIISNTVYAIEVDYGCDGNLISGNRIYSNRNAISLFNGNQNKPSAIISSYDSSTGVVTGTSEPGDVIEIFSSGGGENAISFLGSTTADGAGDWTAIVTNSYQSVSVTATNATNNTSEITGIGCNPSTGPYWISTADNNTVVCVGGTKKLIANGGYLGEGGSYEWFEGFCGGTPIWTGSSIVVSPSSTTTYYVRATGSCNTTECVSITLTLASDIYVTKDKFSVCAGESATLTVYTAETAFTWKPSETLSGSTGQSVIATPLQTTTYSVVTQYGCVATVELPVEAAEILVSSSSSTCNDIFEQWFQLHDGGDYDQTSKAIMDSQKNLIVAGIRKINGNTDVSIIKYSPSGLVLWQTIYSTSTDDRVNSVALDNQDNIYITGVAEDHLFTIKYNSSGVQQWINTLAISGMLVQAEGMSIAVDPNGNVYVTGSYKNGTHNDIITVKYDQSGNVLWNSTYDRQTLHDLGTDILVDNSGNVFITGKTQTSTSSDDFTTIQYNSSGVQQWATSYDNNGSSEIPSKIRRDGNGNIFVGGTAVGSGKPDYLTIKYDPSGVQQWANYYNGASNLKDELKGLGVDASGNIFVTGTSESSITTYDMATIKYDNAGATVWTNRYEGPLEDYAADLQLDNTGNVYVTGTGYNGSVKSYVITTLKYANSGTLNWMKQHTSSPGSSAISMTVDNQIVYVTGVKGGMWFNGPSPYFDWISVKYECGPESRVCNGSSVTLTASGAEAYHWEPSAGVSDVNSASPVITPTATTTYTVTGTNASGCIDIETVLVYVDPCTLGCNEDKAICIGESTLLTICGGDGNYTWSPATGLSSTTGATVAASPLVTTTYTVTGTTVGTVVTQTMVVSVRPKPIATITALTNCETTDVNFLGSGSSLNGPLTYSWQFGDGHISNLQNPSHHYQQPGLYLTILTVNDGFCSYVCSLYVKAGTPQAYFDAAPVCIGAPLIVSNVTAGATSYSWNFGDQSTSASQNPQHFFAATGTYTITLTVVSDGCESILSKPVMVSSPISTASFMVSSNPVCINTPITFTNTSSIDATQFLWTFGDGSESHVEDPVHSYTEASGPPGSFKVVLKASNGGCYKESIKYITVKPAPVAAINGASVVCDGSSINLASHILNIQSPSSQYTYQWSVSNGIDPTHLIDPAMGGTLAVLPVGATGTYTLTVTDGCNQQATAIKVVNVQNLPEVTVDLVHGITCDGLHNGSATVSGTTGSDVITWTPSGETGTTATNLFEGLNQITVNNGTCSRTLSIDVPFSGSSLSVNASPTGCNSGSTLGSASAIISNGTAMNYTWTTLTGTVLGNSLVLNDLATGIYKLVVVDENNCTLEKIFQVTPALLSVTTSNTQTCSGESATINSIVSISGPNAFSGTTSWNPMTNGTPGSTLGTDGTISLEAGDYRVTVVDNYYQCTAFHNFTVSPRPAMVLSYTALNPKCHGGETGSAVVSITGGSAPFEYEWLDGSTLVSAGQEMNNVASGTYQVSISDANECIATISVEISDPIAFTVTHSYNASIPCQLSAEIQGGSPNYTYNWIRTKDELNVDIPDNTENTTQTQFSTAIGENLPLGSYIIQVIDGNGCIAENNTEVSMGSRPSRTFTLKYAWERPGTIVDPPDDVPMAEVFETVTEIREDLRKKVVKCLDILEASANNSFKESCFNVENFHDVLSIGYNLPYHHYTLYYYDRAGNLTKTVPPEGVDLLTDSEVNSLISYRSDTTNTPPVPLKYRPDHTLITTYDYNSLAQLVTQKTADGGKSDFVYNSIGQLRYSQNAKQLGSSHFTYTKYDYLGKVIEVGKSELSAGDLLADLDPDNTSFPSTGNSEVTMTVYSDAGAVDYNGKPQRFITNRVSHTFTDRDGDPATTGDRAETFYSYDPHGNVEWLVQDIPGFSKNYIAYDFDLFSGKVLKVRYNENRLDRFFHRYSYDEDNRLTLVETSRNGWLWDKDANYSYYAHGPLKRIGIGEDKIQGIDNIYTIEGWLKSVNTPMLNASMDPGNDGGTSGYLNDVFGMSLGYYYGDFIRRTPTDASVLNMLNAYCGTGKDLYNGNISSWATNTSTDHISTSNTFAFENEIKREAFTYDQLNRLKQSELKVLNEGAWVSMNNFSTTYNYDKNGNILNLDRNDNTSVLDDLEYSYFTGTNKLASVTDGSTSAVSGTLANGTRTYQYDAIGNLINESGNELIGDPPVSVSVSSSISWNLYGKVESVNKTVGSDLTQIKFGYDASGNRISKEIISPDGISSTTYYVRDASGNVMGTYERKNRAAVSGEPNYPGGSMADYFLREEPIYGSSRIGQVVNTSFTEYKIGSASFNTSAGNNVEFLAVGVEESAEAKQWISPSMKQFELSGGAKTCDCIIREGNFNGTNNAYGVPENVAEFMGDAGNGVSVAEDINGNLKFYAVTAKKYLGNQNVCLIYDVNGDLMKSSSGIMASGDAKPVIMKRPGGNNEYCLFTVGTDGKPYMHIINMSMPGYGVATALGEVTQKNIQLDNSGSYGMHVTALEDAITGLNYMYTTRYVQPVTAADQGTTEIVAFEFAEGAVTPVPEVMASIPGKDDSGNGEIHISKDGKLLGYYNRKKHVGGFIHRETEIQVFTINPNNRKEILPSMTKVIADNGAGTLGKASMDFSELSGNLYLGQNGIYLQNYSPGMNSERNIFRYNLSSSDPLTGRSLANTMSPTGEIQYGEVRRAKDLMAYVPGKGNDATFTTISGVTGGTNPLSVAAGYELAGNLPGHVYKVGSTEVPEPIERVVGKKMYELTDHLGNVRAVVSDRRAVDPATFTNFADVESFTDYYPFGMVMPARSFNSPDYRYGFNGMEKDDEIKGISGSSYDFGARMYDPRVGKWLSLDPKAQTMPGLSPYNFCLNSPIIFVDPNGEYPIYIVTRSYAPFKTFGVPGDEFYGDNRGHTLDKGASYRTLASINYDTETKRTEAFGGRSRSHNVRGTKDAISFTQVDNRKPTGNEIDVHSFGNNAAQSGSWDIDQFTKIKVTTEGDIKKDHVLNISGTVSGDDFPNQESMIYDSKGNTLWLGNYATKGNSVTGPTMDLANENEDDVHIQINLRIKVNKDGVFQGVMQTGKDGKETMISIDDWNKQKEQK